MRKMFAVAPAAPDRCPAKSRQFVRLPACPGSDSCGLMTDASHDGADRAPRQGDRLVLGPLGETAPKNFLSVSELARDREMAATYVLGQFRLDAETDTLFRGGEPVANRVVRDAHRSGMLSGLLNVSLRK